MVTSTYVHDVKNAKRRALRVTGDSRLAYERVFDYKNEKLIFFGIEYYRYVGREPGPTAASQWEPAGEYPIMALRAVYATRFQFRTNEKGILISRIEQVPESQRRGVVKFLEEHEVKFLEEHEVYRGLERVLQFVDRQHKLGQKGGPTLDDTIRHREFIRANPDFLKLLR